MTARNVSRPSATVCRAGIAQKQCQSCGRCSPDAHTTMHAPRGFVPAAAATGQICTMLVIQRLVSIASTPAFHIGLSVCATHTAGGIAGLIMLTSLYSANPTVRAEGTDQ